MAIAREVRDRWLRGRHRWCCYPRRAWNVDQISKVAFTSADSALGVINILNDDGFDSL